MKILGILGRTGDPFAHDGSAALLVDNKIVYAIEQERLSRHRYAMSEGAPDAVKDCLAQTGHAISDMDFIAYGWIPDMKSGVKISENITVSDELTHIIAPPELYSRHKTPQIHFIQHHYAHAAAAYFTSGFESAAALIVDGRGEGESISLYHAKGGKLELIESYPMIYSLGVFYSAAGTRAGIGGKSGHSGPGKLMGLAPFGQVREEIDFSFDAETGKFKLPASVRAKSDALPAPPIAGNMWKFWLEYYSENFYPYEGLNHTEPSASYHPMHYVDLAASVQSKLEDICLSLAKRLQKLTGEKNLVLGGGCALNCTMNAFLSKQKVFEQIYIFPGANDAGCSIGAALALSAHLKPMPAALPRLDAPAFGRAYSNEEILAAIESYGFEYTRLTPSGVAERVAEDLANDKIVAWFQGKDEFGPRALGRRSFLANPANRENLGRLNTVKGREMWRPLAPSILDDEAETVLEGSMERGFHRYMLGVATIRPEWRERIPATLHIDFTCRPHFVQQEKDGAYWEMIRRFYEKTGIPLVCNTSLNVAGQPIVHSPEEALEVFARREDVQSLALGDFYLTKSVGDEEKHLSEKRAESAYAFQDKVFEK